MGRTSWLSLLSGLLIGLMVGPATGLLAQDTSVENFNPDFRGYPLPYFQALYVNHPYPVSQHGIVLTEVEQGSPLQHEGVTSGGIILRIDGEPVWTQHQAERYLAERWGEEVEIYLYVETPQFERVQSRPLIEPRRMVEPYRERTITVRYELPGPTRTLVYVRPGGELYHKQGYRHSPSKDTSDTFEFRHEAEEQGIYACPICFPSSQGGGLGEIIDQEVVNLQGGGGAGKLVKQYRSKYPEIQKLPPELRGIFSDLKEVMIREDIDPKVVLLDSDQVFGFGLPSGEILFSRAYWQLAEGRDEKMAILGHLLAHADLNHEPSSKEQARFRELLIRTVRETTGRQFSFEYFRRYAEQIPGFSYYRPLLENGYTRQDERQAFFLSMAYLYMNRAKMNAIRGLLLRTWDMEGNVNQSWLDYLIQHPMPDGISENVETWKTSIPEHLSGFRQPRDSRRLDVGDRRGGIKYDR